MQYVLELRSAVPRCDCPEHGVITIGVPWAEPGSRFTVQFEALAVEVIAACRSLTQAADLLRLHWASVQRLIDRAVERGLARRSTAGLKQVGLDEKSFQRGQRYSVRISLIVRVTTGALRPACLRIGPSRVAWSKPEVCNHKCPTLHDNMRACEFSWEWAIV